jgi:putative redox protein
VSDLVATIRQVRATPMPQGLVREHWVLVERPTAKASTGGRWGASCGCFMSNLMAAAGARNIPVEGLEVTVRGALAAAPPRFEAIELEVRGARLAADVLDKLITIAERACIVHNTLAPAVSLTVRRP